MIPVQHDQADQGGGRGDQRVDHGPADQAAAWWPAAAFVPHIGARTLWAAAKAGRVRTCWNRTGTRLRYNLGDVLAEYPHLLPENVHKRLIPSVDACGSNDLV